MRFEVTVRTYDGLMSSYEVDAKSPQDARRAAKEEAKRAYARVEIMAVRAVGYAEKPHA